jgi:hypothetical protein
LRRKEGSEKFGGWDRVESESGEPRDKKGKNESGWMKSPFEGCFLCKAQSEKIWEGKGLKTWRRKEVWNNYFRTQANKSGKETLVCWAV